MGYRTVEEAAAEAYKSKQMYEYLTGKNGYAFPSFFQQINVCTDWTRIIPAIYKLYEKGENVKELLQECNLRAENIIYFQRDKEKEKKSPFKISPTIIKGLRKYILSQKEELQNIYPYGKNGYNAYEDVLRLNHNFAQSWDETLWP